MPNWTEQDLHIVGRKTDVTFRIQAVVFSHLPMREKDRPVRKLGAPSLRPRNEMLTTQGESVPQARSLRVIILRGNRRLSPPIL